WDSVPTNLVTPADQLFPDVPPPTAWGMSVPGAVGPATLDEDQRATSSQAQAAASSKATQAPVLDERGAIQKAWVDVGRRLGRWDRSGRREYDGLAAPPDRNPDEDARDPDLKERMRLSFLDSYYRGTLAGSSRLALMAHLAATPDDPGMTPETKR